MIEVKVEINRRLTIVDVAAVRIHPTERQPEPGEMCEYKIYINKIETHLSLEFPYGDGADLAIEMIKIYKENI